MDEAGLRGYTYVVWYGMWFPAGAPAEYVARIRDAVVKAFENAETRRAFGEQGFIPVASTPQEFSHTIIEAIELHRRLVERIGTTQQ